MGTYAFAIGSIQMTTDAKPAGADAEFDAKALEIADKIAWEVGNAEVLEFACRLRIEWEREQAQQEPFDALHLAILFHHTYERLAPSVGYYDTRKETRVFDPESANGKLMLAVCTELLPKLYTHPASAQLGMVSVPIEPTEAMVEAAFRGCSWPQDFGADAQSKSYKEAVRIYRAMLAAAQKEQS